MWYSYPFCFSYIELFQLKNKLNLDSDLFWFFWIFSRYFRIWWKSKEKVIYLHYLLKWCYGYIYTRINAPLLFFKVLYHILFASVIYDMHLFDMFKGLSWMSLSLYLHPDSIEYVALMLLSWSHVMSIMRWKLVAHVCWMQVSYVFLSTRFGVPCL